MPKIVNCLWFDTEAEAAAKLYVSLFPNSKIGAISRYPSGSTVGEPGKVLTVEFELDGAPFTGLNGGPQFPHSEAISFQVMVEDQAELDHYWNGLTANGGQESQCGWLKDPFGISWQVVPKRMGQWMSHPATASKVMAAFMPMKKLDMATLEAAAAG